MSILRVIFDLGNQFDERRPGFLDLMELSDSNESDKDVDSIDFKDEGSGKLLCNDILDFVGDLLKGSTQIVDEVLQGSEVHTEKKEEKGPPTFAGWIYLHFLSAKMDLFRQIVCEMKTCKNGVEPDEKAKTILNMLPKYSWRAKAVLTLAAFAVVFGDFCVFAKFHHLAYEQVLKSSLAIQKGVPFSANSSELLKRQVKIQQLKEIIETILQVMDLLIDELMDKLQMDKNYNPIITTVVACAIEVSNLTNDKESDESQNLSPYLKQIQEQQIILEKERDEFNDRCEAIGKLEDPVEILKTNILLNDNQPELIDASSYEPVNIDVLRGKKVFLYISRLRKLTKYRIRRLQRDDYTIVWIPIVEWIDELRNKLDTKMFCYVLPSFSLSVNGIKFIKALRFRFGHYLLKGPRNLENPFILYLPENLGNQFVFFLLPPLVGGGGTIRLETKKFTFHYGGEDDELNKQFAEKVTKVASDEVLKRKFIEIKHYVHTRKAGFFACLPFATKKTIDYVTPVIQSLRSEKNLRQWAMLCNKSSVVISGDGSRFLTVLDEFDQWKNTLGVDEKSFEITFVNYYNTQTSP